MKMNGHFALTLFSFYLPTIAKARTEILASFNCLRTRQHHFIYDAM